MSNYPSIDAFAELADQRACIYNEMETAVKELVNLLLPANYVVQSMERKAEPIEGSGSVTVRKDELDSLVHLIGHAHGVAEKLRAIISAAKLTSEISAPRDEARQLEGARAGEPGRAQDARSREDNWRKEARELSRPVKVA